MDMRRITPVPGIGWAFIDGNGNVVTDDRLKNFNCCNTCRNCRKSSRFAMLAWCMRYPSEQPNVSLFQVCPEFDRGHRTPVEITASMNEVKRHPERYAPGDFKKLKVGGKVTTMVLEEVYSDGRTRWQLHDELTEGGDSDVGT